MEPWFIALAAIFAMAAVGAAMVRRRGVASPPRSMAALLGVRLLVIVIVTALVAIARVEVGSLVAAAVGLLGVAVGIIVLIRTGYAVIPGMR